MSDEYKTMIYERARQKRDNVLEELSKKFGLDEFISRHTGLNLNPHSRENCELPYYINHMSNIETLQSNHGDKIPVKPAVIENSLFMSCGIEQSNLEKALSLEKNNPLVFYSQLEELLEPTQVKLAVLPAYDWRFDESEEQGSLGDILIYVESYGDFAEELENSIENSIKRIKEQMGQTNIDDSPHPLNGKCVGFFRGALGVDKEENPYFYIDLIQTDGYRNEKGIGNILPGKLRKRYLDGKGGITRWYYEGLNSIEKACTKLEIPIAIITWDELKSRNPDLKSSSSRKMYQDISKRAGYSHPSKITLEFPMHVYGPSKRTIETHIYER